MAKGVVFGGLNGGGGSNIKSKQSGIITMNSTLVTVAISPIDPTKSIIRIKYLPGNDSITAKIINATTIQFDAYSSGSNISVEWEVIEFNNVKSKQSGSQAFTTSEDTKSVTITSVNTEKALIFATIRTNYANTNGTLHLIKYKFTSATSISLIRTNVFSANAVIEWQVIEFN